MIKRNVKYGHKKAVKYLLPKTLRTREHSFKVSISSYVVRGKCKVTVRRNFNLCGISMLLDFSTYFILQLCHPNNNLLKKKNSTPFGFWHCMKLFFLRCYDNRLSPVNISIQQIRVALKCPFIVIIFQYHL